MRIVIRDGNGDRTFNAVFERARYYAADKWKASVPDAIKPWVTPPNPKHLLKQAKDLPHFPYCKAFGENRIKVIQLKPLQANLLAELASWSVSNDHAVNTIVGTFGEATLPAPKPKR